MSCCKKFPFYFEKKWIHQNQPHLIQNLHLPIVVLHLQMLIILHLVLMQEGLDLPLFQLIPIIPLLQVGFLSFLWQQAIHLNLLLWLLEPLMLNKQAIHLSLPLWLLEPLMLDKVSVEVFFC
ncbi:uncharacterized protein LOC106462164 isoform X1 [Limulus polyphemus]|uniref:Uncharacterized protein LOC106462164 isoform X1 n=1 Tax=Limulus polyphemus TaxID=6850 RepID=A0ABM1SN35_LIMPO|nr:uncharacterized protein LOC106462164 isoform X1 [Limulus polyphemus]